MKHKVYEYEGKHYCEEDISCADPKYAGDIWDLYWVLHREGHIEENCTYYLPEYPDDGIYEDEEEAVLDNLETFDINVCGEYDDDDPGDDIDADIQAADMAAEDMPDNTEGWE
jgi:hypothetical protein